MAKSVQKKSGSRFVGMLVVIGIVGIATLGYTMSRPRAGVGPVDPNLPAGTAEGYLVGNPDAPVQVIEFGDFECPACAQWSNLTEPDVRERLIQTGQISFRFFDFPLDMHPNTWAASNAAACAADQGKFLEMHDRIFATQDQWDGRATSNPKRVLQRLAGEIGANVGDWETCFDSQKHYPRIKANLEEGVRRGVNSTPTFIIGGQLIPGAPPYDSFKKLVDAELAKKGVAAPGDSAAATTKGK